MRNRKYIWIIAVAGAALVGTLFYWHEAHFESSEDAAFLANLSTLSQGAAPLANINGFKIENERNGSYSINGDVAAPGIEQYYTDKPVSLAQFASSTDMTIAQVNALINVMRKYPYIGMIEGDVNVVGTCTEQGSGSYPCTAIKFNLRQSLLTHWFSDPATWYSNGYMYVPFALSASDQSYLHRYFTEVKEVGPHWYSFSGQHL